MAIRPVRSLCVLAALLLAGGCILPARPRSGPATATTPTEPAAGIESPAPSPAPPGTAQPLSPVKPIGISNGLEVHQLACWGGGHLQSLAYSADGGKLVAVTSLGTVVYDAESLARLSQTAEGASERAWYLPRRSVTSPDGSMVATVEGNTARVARADGGEEVTLGYPTDVDMVMDVAFSSDASIIATGHMAGAVCLWRNADGALIRTLLLQSPVLRVALSPDGSLVASGSEDGAIRLWQVADGAPVYSFQAYDVPADNPYARGIAGLAFSLDGATLAVGDSNGCLRLYRVSDGALLRTLEGSTGEVLGLAVSPDATLVASAAVDGEVRLWRTSDGALVGVLRGHAGSVFGAAFSLDGTLLATAGTDGTVRLWQTASGSPLRVLQSNTKGVDAVAFSPDGTTLACGSRDGMVRLWQVADGVPLATLTGHTGLVRSVAYSPDGAILASAGEDKTVRLWQVSTGTLLHTLEGHAALVTSVAFSPDAATLVSASDDGTLRFWRAADGAPLNAPEAGELPGAIYCLAFSPDGTMLASGDEYADLVLWEVATAQQRWALHGHTDWVYGLAFSADGALLVSGSFDGTIRLWGIEQPQAPPGAQPTTTPLSLARVETPVPPPTRTASPFQAGPVRRLAERGSGGPLTAVAYAADGSAVAVAYGLSLHICDPATLEDRQVLDLKGPVMEVAFSPDGATLAAASWTEVYLFRVADGKLLRTVRGRETVAFSADGQSLVTASGREVTLYRSADGTLAREYEELGAGTPKVAISPDGRTVAGSSFDGVVIWRASESEPLGVDVAGGLGNIAFSPDGATLALANRATVQIHRAANGTLVRRLQGHDGAVTCLAFSPDGTTLATGASDSTIRIWRASNGQLLYTLHGHDRPVVSLAYGPDSRTLVSGSEDDTVRLWQLNGMGEETLTKTLLQWCLAALLLFVVLSVMLAGYEQLNGGPWYTYVAFGERVMLGQSVRTTYLLKDENGQPVETVSDCKFADEPVDSSSLVRTSAGENYFERRYIPTWLRIADRVTYPLRWTGHLLVDGILKSRGGPKEGPAGL